MENITKDYLWLIARYLNPIDIYHWGSVQLQWDGLFKTFFYKRLIEKIDKSFRFYFDKVASYDEFVESMKASGAVISGSFILQMITGEMYPNSDIDIYVNHPGKPDYNEMEKLLYTRHPTRYIGSVYNDAAITCVREYQIKEIPFWKFKCFQVINIKAHPREFIVCHFDFDIIKNGFWYDEDGPHIAIYNLDSIAKKTITLNKEEYFRTTPWAMPKNTENRLQKYQNRGFEIIIV